LRTGKVLEADLVARRIGVSSSILVASPAYAEKRGLPASRSALTTHECIGARIGPTERMVWHLDGPYGESQVEVTGRFHYLSRRELPRAVKAFMDFNVAQIRERELGGTLPPPRPRGRPKGRRGAR
jgi:hypothetical protein